MAEDDLDTAVFSGNYSDYTIVQNGNALTITGPDGTDILIDVNALSFVDQTVQITVPTVALNGDDNPNTLTGGEGDDILSGFRSR